MWQKGRDRRRLAKRGEQRCAAWLRQRTFTPWSHQPLMLGRDQLRADLRTQRRVLQDVPGYPQVAPEPWERRWRRRAYRDKGPGLEQSCWERWHTGPCCSCHQQLPVQGEGVHKEIHTALQLETRRRKRKGTCCFEFRKLQISILQGTALIHLLSAKGQRDIVCDYHHPLQGHRPWEPAFYLFSTLTIMKPQPRLQLSSCTQLWSTRQGSVTAGVLTACATQEAQENSALGMDTQHGRARRWQRQEPKPNQGDSWQKGHSETEGFESCMCWKCR